MVIYTLLEQLKQMATLSTRNLLNQSCVILIISVVEKTQLSINNFLPVKMLKVFYINNSKPKKC